jgi:hypothetical protein
VQGSRWHGGKIAGVSHAESYSVLGTRYSVLGTFRYFPTGRFALGAAWL